MSRIPSANYWFTDLTGNEDVKRVANCYVVSIKDDSLSGSHEAVVIMDGQYRREQQRTLDRMVLETERRNSQK